MTRLIITGSRWYNDHAAVFTMIDHWHKRAGGQLLTLAHVDRVGAESMVSEMIADNPDVGLVDEPWPAEKWEEMVDAEAAFGYGFFRRDARNDEGLAIVERARARGTPFLEDWI